MITAHRHLLTRGLLMWIASDPQRRFEGETRDAFARDVARLYLRETGAAVRESDVVRFVLAASEMIGTPLLHIIPLGESGLARIEITNRGGSEMRLLNEQAVEESLQDASVSEPPPIPSPAPPAQVRPRTPRTAQQLRLNVTIVNDARNVLSSSPAKEPGALERFLRSYPGIVTSTAVLVILCAWVLGAIGVLSWETARLLPAWIHGG